METLEFGRQRSSIGNTAFFFSDTSPCLDIITQLPNVGVSSSIQVSRFLSSHLLRLPL